MMWSVHHSCHCYSNSTVSLCLAAAGTLLAKGWSPLVPPLPQIVLLGKQSFAFCAYSKVSGSFNCKICPRPLEQAFKAMVQEVLVLWAFFFFQGVGGVFFPNPAIFPVVSIWKFLCLREEVILQSLYLLSLLPGEL